MLAASFYWNDPTILGNTRGGHPGDPFNTGVLQFYNDRTLQYQAPRMGGLAGTVLGAALPGTFTITPLASGLLTAVPNTPQTTAYFAAVQFAANAAAARLGIGNRVKVTGEIDPPTVELILTIAQHAPRNPAMTVFTQLAADPATALSNGAAYDLIATRADLVDGLAAIKPGMSRKAKIIASALIATLAVGGVVVHRARNR